MCRLFCSYARQESRHMVAPIAFCTSAVDAFGLHMNGGHAMLDDLRLTHLH